MVYTDRHSESVLRILPLASVIGGLAFGCAIDWFMRIDTSLPQGEMLFQIIGAIAQWERSLIVERVKVGLQHARSKGTRLGRPPLRRLTPEEIVNLRKERIRAKTPFRGLAAKYGISVFTAHTLCGIKSQRSGRTRR